MSISQIVETEIHSYLSKQNSDIMEYLEAHRLDKNVQNLYDNIWSMLVKPEGILAMIELKIMANDLHSSYLISSTTTK